MILLTHESDHIIRVGKSYLGQPFDYTHFNCVHFVRKVYSTIGIELPLLSRSMQPPNEFHLSRAELMAMPIGHTIFLKRRASVSDRLWTHVAIIFSPSELIHCTRHFEGGVVITPATEFFEAYTLVTK